MLRSKSLLNSVSLTNRGISTINSLKLRHFSTRSSKPHPKRNANSQKIVYSKNHVEKPVILDQEPEKLKAEQHKSLSQMLTDIKSSKQIKAARLLALLSLLYLGYMAYDDVMSAPTETERVYRKKKAMYSVLSPFGIDKTEWFIERYGFTDAEKERFLKDSGKDSSEENRDVNQQDEDDFELPPVEHEPVDGNQVKVLNKHVDGFSDEDIKNAREGGYLQYTTIKNSDTTQLQLHQNKAGSETRMLSRSELDVMMAECVSLLEELEGKTKNAEEKRSGMSVELDGLVHHFYSSMNSSPTATRVFSPPLELTNTNTDSSHWFNLPNTVENTTGVRYIDLQDRNIPSIPLPMFNCIGDLQDKLAQLPRLIHPYFVKASFEDDYVHQLQGYSNYGLVPRIQCTQYPIQHKLHCGQLVDYDEHMAKGSFKRTMDTSIYQEEKNYILSYVNKLKHACSKSDDLTLNDLTEAAESARERGVSFRERKTGMLDSVKGWFNSKDKDNEDREYVNPQPDAPSFVKQHQLTSDLAITTNTNTDTNTNTYSNTTSISTPLYMQDPNHPHQLLPTFPVNSTSKPVTAPSKFPSTVTQSTRHLSLEINLPLHDPEAMDLLMLRSTQGLALLNVCMAQFEALKRDRARQLKAEAENASNTNTNTSNTSNNSNTNTSNTSKSFKDVKMGDSQMKSIKNMGAVLASVKEEEYIQSAKNTESANKPFLLQLNDQFEKLKVYVEDLKTNKPNSTSTTQLPLIEKYSEIWKEFQTKVKSSMMSTFTASAASESESANLPRSVVLQRFSTHSLSLPLSDSSLDFSLASSSIYTPIDDWHVYSRERGVISVSEVPPEHIPLLPLEHRIRADPRAHHWEPSPLSWFDYFKWVVNFPLACLRLSLSVPLLFGVWGLAKISLAGLNLHKDNNYAMDVPRAKWRRQAIKLSTSLVRTILFINGFYHIKQLGRPVSNVEAPIVVANHTSLLDAPLIYYLTQCPMFISKSEVADVPLFGPIMLATGSLLLDRSSKASRSEIQHEIIRRVTYSPPNPNNQHLTEYDYFPHLAIFPEGTTTSGKCVMKFKRGAFIAGTPIQPVCIDYPHDYFNPCYAGADKTGLLSVSRILTQFYSDARIRYLPVYYPSEEEKKNPDLYASNVQKIMANTLNVPVIDKYAY